MQNEINPAEALAAIGLTVHTPETAEDFRRLPALATDQPQQAPQAGESQNDQSQPTRAHKWRAKIRENYESFAEFRAYDDIYKLAARTGYASAAQMWRENPTVEGSTNPADFRKVEGDDDAEAGEIITDLNSLINSHHFDAINESQTGNDLWFNDPERAERINKAAEFGADGSTHQERIADQAEAVKILKNDGIFKAQFLAQGYTPDAAEALADALAEFLASELAEVEKWHDQNGSLFDEIG